MADKKKIRACLRCGQQFKSDGPWNRICPACNGHKPDAYRGKFTMQVTHGRSKGTAEDH